MAYIGNQPSESFTSFATQEFTTSATTSYTLDHAVTNENEIALFINNVRQQPGSGKAYTATGTALTLSEATASTDTMYCVFLGRALQTVTPATNSITAAMVGNDLISGQTALASEPADTDEFLVSDAGTLKRIDYSLIKGGGITEVDQWRLTAHSTGSQNPISSNLERADTPTTAYIGTGMTESSGVFTFPSTGIWKIETVFLFYKSSSGGGNMYGHASVTTNNSTYADIIEAVKLELDGGISAYGSMLFDVTDTTTHKVRFKTNFANSGDQIQGNTDRNLTYFTFTRLGDT